MGYRSLSCLMGGILILEGGSFFSIRESETRRKIRSCMYLSMTNNNRLAGQVNNVPGGKINTPLSYILNKIRKAIEKQGE